MVRVTDGGAFLSDGGTSGLVFEHCYFEATSNVEERPDIRLDTLSSSQSRNIVIRECFFGPASNPPVDEGIARIEASGQTQVIAEDNHVSLKKALPDGPKQVFVRVATQNVYMHELHRNYLNAPQGSGTYAENLFDKAGFNSSVTWSSFPNSGGVGDDEQQLFWDGNIESNLLLGPKFRVVDLTNSSGTHPALEDELVRVNADAFSHTIELPTTPRPGARIPFVTDKLPACYDREVESL